MKASEKYRVALNVFSLIFVLTVITLGFSFGWKVGLSAVAVLSLAMTWSCNECRKDAEEEENR